MLPVEFVSGVRYRFVNTVALCALAAPFATRLYSIFPAMLDVVAKTEPMTIVARELVPYIGRTVHVSFWLSFVVKFCTNKVARIAPLVPRALAGTVADMTDTCPVTLDTTTLAAELPIFVLAPIPHFTPSSCELSATST